MSYRYPYNYRKTGLQMVQLWCICGLLCCCCFNWGRVTHICIGNINIIGSDNGLSPGRCQAIILTNARVLLFGPLGTKFSDILNLKPSSAKWESFCLGLNVLTSFYNLAAKVYETPINIYCQKLVYCRIKRVNKWSFSLYLWGVMNAVTSCMASFDVSVL